MGMKVKTGDGWPHDITKKDLDIKFFNGSGKGGQNRNKNANCVHMKHIPTGATSQSQEHKSQQANLECAFRKLTSLLVPRMLNEQQKERFSAGFERIRTYNECRDTVKDHRTGGEYSFSSVLSGRLTPVINDCVLQNDRGEK